MKNQNISNLDLHQMQVRAFDESIDANRVVIVGQEFNLDQDKMAEAVRQGVSGIKIEIPNQQKQEIIIPETQIHKIEVPQIVEKIVFKEVHVPVIETRIERVEIPVVVPEVKIIEIEKQVIVKEIEIKEIASNDTIRKLQIIMLALNLLTMLIAIFKR